MDLLAWADDHWVLLWKPGTRPYAGLLFVVALVLPLAFLTVLFTNWVLDQDEPEDPRRRG